MRFSNAIMFIAGSATCAQAFVAVPPAPFTASTATSCAPRAVMPTRAKRAGVSVHMSATSQELPSQASRQLAMYDMLYVERLPEEQQMSSGLFLPSKENPRMHVCKVVSVGHGREGESGFVTPNDALKAGDLVYVKDPYGVGPRDDEFAGKKFSFVRYGNICGVIPNSKEYENAARQAGVQQEELRKMAGASGLTF